MRMGDYFRLLADHGFRVTPRRWAMMVLITGFTINNSILTRIQHWIHGKRIAAQPLDPAPLFLLGHWRSGTTLLHELLSLDDRLAFPSTIECFIPSHFLVSEPLLKPMLGLVLPARRPMDNMSTGPDLPQEDEFALIGLGAPTPYLRMAFPNEPRPFDCLLDMDGVPADIEQEFAGHLDFFFRSLMLKKQKRLLLKSPTHTGRIGWLADRYPDSRFIHISRNPIEVFLSTKRLWRSLDEVQGFQLPSYSDQELETMIFQMHQRMYHGYLSARSRLPANRLVEIQFEQLIAEPEATIRKACEQLEWELPESVCEQIRLNMDARRSHESANYQPDPEMVQRVIAQTHPYAQTFGYRTSDGKSIAVA